MNRNNITTATCIIAIVLMCVSEGLADNAHGIQVLKISPQDERVVVKTADGKTQVIKPGDALASGTVIEIAEGRVVLEERQGNDKETVIIRLKDGKQTVERIRKTPPGNRQQGINVSTQPSDTGKSKIGRKSSIN